MTTTTPAPLTVGTNTESAMRLTQTALALDAAINKALTPWDLSWPRAQAMLVLAGEDRPRPLGVIARRLGQQAQSTTEIADRLERARLLERSRDPRDRRLVLIGLTEAGAAVAAAIREPVEEAARQFLIDLQRVEAE